MKLLVLGSKEYPMGNNQGDDLPSGGIETYVEALTNELSKNNKIQISIITRKFLNQQNYTKKGNIEIYRVNWLKGHLLRTPTFILNSYFIASKLDYDIILAHGELAVTLGAFLSKIKKKPIIAIPHGLLSKEPEHSFLLKNISYLLERWALSNSSCVVIESKKDTKNIREISPMMEPIHIPTGVDLNKFSKKSNKLRNELDIDKNMLIILSTSNLIRVKGVKYLIECARILKGKFIIALAGTGPQEIELRQKCKELKLDKEIRFLGFRKDVQDLLASADIYVLPSLQEGLPLGLLEAMASSLPCVVTDLGLPVENNRTGLVVPPANSKKLASALQRLIDNKKLRIRLGKNAREYTTQFSWKNTADKYIELFQTLSKAYFS